MVTLPDWYNSDTANPAITPARSRGKIGLHLRRTLEGLGWTVAEELSGPVRTAGWSARLETRAKIVSAVVLIVGTTLMHGVLPLVALFVLALGLALSGGVSVGRLGRVWLSVPLFTLAIALPATLNLVTPGDPLVTLIHLGAGAKAGHWALPESVTITDAGVFVALRFFLRSLDCVTLAFLLIATTEHASLVSGLRRLGMPKVFGMVLTMTQRYLTVLLRCAEEIHLAKLSRTMGPVSVRSEQRWAASGIGILFRKSQQLSMEVYNAMLARGYDGDIRTWTSARLSVRDWVGVGVSLAIVAALVLVDRAVM